MGGKLVKSEASYSFALLGGSEVDAELLAKAIQDFAQLTKATVNAEDPEAYIKLNVTAFRQGSFIVDFSTVCELQNLFSAVPQALNMAKTAIETIKGYFELKKFLKGKKPQAVETEGSETHIRRQDGAELVVPKGSARILENAHIDNLTINIGTYVQIHGGEGFSISTEGGRAVFSQEDMQNIKKPVPTEKVTHQRCTEVTAFLPIKKPDILGKSAWEFRYNDRSIRAVMEDEDWLESVRTGKISFRSGDALHARLEVAVSLDETGEPVEDSEKYTVKKVLEHLHDAEQTTLFDS